MAEQNSVPTSAIYVTLSTTVANLIGKMSAPWTAYQVYLWQKQYDGMVFPSDYAQNMSDTLVVLFTLFVGIGHIAIIALYRNWPTQGIFRYLWPKAESTEPQWLSQLRQKESTLNLHEPAGEPKP